MDKKQALPAPTRPVHWIHSKTVTYLIRLGIGLVLMTTAVLAAASYYLYQLYQQTPGYDDFVRLRDIQPSIVLSAQGKHLTTFRQNYQEKRALEDVSPWVIKALIATEDHRFFDHPGIDYRRTISSIIHTMAGSPQGGSTITQQLVRNLFPEDIGRARTAERKLREMVTAYKLERRLSKEEILETYLNTVPFLYNVVGIEMAARTYYGKSPADLDIPESAMLVGMLKGTRYYNPILNAERAQQRRNVVLAQMVKHGEMDELDFLVFRSEPLRLQFNRPREQLPAIAPHFVVHLRQWALAWARENGHNLYTDGLIIHTTLDDSLQQMANEVVSRQAQALQNIADVEWGQRTTHLRYESPAMYASLRKKVEPFSHFWKSSPALEEAFIRESPRFRQAVAEGQSEAEVMQTLRGDADFMQALRSDKTRLEAGFVAIDPVSGEVKAWVGSRDFNRDQYDHVARAARQPGSTFKPFVYAAALEQGMAPSHTYRDEMIEIIAPDGDVWRPTDMTGITGRRMTLREGLVQSKNTITAQVMLDVGYERVAQLAQKSGIKQSFLKPVPSLALGTSPVTLLEMVSAYTTIAQQGQHRDPVFVRRITDRYGEVVQQFGDPPNQVLSEKTAQQLIDMMRGVVQHGTGTALVSRFNIQADVAGKSGTTQNNTDGWFILMHPHLVAGAWVGFNDQRVTMRSDYWGQGGQNAILLVGDFFQEALKSGKVNAKARFTRGNQKKGTVIEARRETPVPAPAMALNAGDSASSSEPPARRSHFPAPPLAPLPMGASADEQASLQRVDRVNVAGIAARRAATVGGSTFD